MEIPEADVGAVASLLSKQSDYAATAEELVDYAWEVVEILRDELGWLPRSEAESLREALKRMLTRYIGLSMIHDKVSRETVELDPDVKFARLALGEDTPNDR